MIDIIQMMVSPLLIIIASISDAVRDTCSHHFHESIFNNPSKFKYSYWNSFTSWRHKYVGGDKKHGRRRFYWSSFTIKLFKWKYFFKGIVIPVQLTDSYHFFKAIMLFALLGAAVCYKPIFTNYMILDFALFGFAWNRIFSLFYNIILIKKKKR